MLKIDNFKWYHYHFLTKIRNFDFFNFFWKNLVKKGKNKIIGFYMEITQLFGIITFPLQNQL